jgi:hypothetical protein
MWFSSAQSKALSSAPLLFMGEDVAGKHGPIFSPDFIRGKALLIWKRIAKPGKDKGHKFLYHTDGRGIEILPIIVNEPPRVDIFP